MSLRKLPEIKADATLPGARWEVRPDALERWEPRAADADEPSTISVYDRIGVDPWTGEGVTAKRISAALRSIGPKDVVVNVNSPGGDFFEGVTIYNLLREHPGKVTVRVLGVAASAASLIAMAGDEIQISLASFLMIHNAWAVAVGNRHDMLKAAETLEPFDGAMADVYAARTGIERKQIVKAMDAETWIGGQSAVDDGWADRLIADEHHDKAEDAQASGRRTLAMAEAAFSRAGLSRKERRDLIKNLTGMPSAADPATPSAGDIAAATEALQRLAKTIHSH